MIRAEDDEKEIFSTIKLSVGDDVSLKYTGIQGKFTGDINIKSAPRTLTTATGELRIKDGKYAAYGQELKIDEGRLFYTGGAIDDPGIAVRAIREIDTKASTVPLKDESADSPIANIIQSEKIIVGVNVTGTLNKPLYRLFSEPETLSQSDILSYLLLGHPTSTASQASGQLLYKAVTSMNFGGTESEQMIQQLTHGFGLDEISIESEEYVHPDSKERVTNTSLLLGKALSPSLFITYSVGLLEPINTLRVHYKIGRKMSIRTESSTTGTNGVDLLYTVERN